MPFEKFILSSSYLIVSVGVGGMEEGQPLDEFTETVSVHGGYSLIIPCDLLPVPIRVRSKSSHVVTWLPYHLPRYLLCGCSLLPREPSHHLDMAFISVGFVSHKSSTFTRSLKSTPGIV